MRRWKCRKCWYIYDPRVGDPDGGIAPGTPYEQIPEDWRCPVCGATKSEFHVLPLLPPPAAPENKAIVPTPLSQSPLATRAGSPMWTVGSLKGWRLGHDKE